MATASAHPNITNMIFDKSEAVTLVIGDKKHEMIVHECYITANSEFFKTALKKEWLVGQTRIITMPTEERKTMTDYLNFTYSGKLSTTCLTEESDDEAAAYLDSFPALAELYTLGKRLLDLVVQNAVIKEFVRLFEAVYEFDTLYPPGQDSIDIIYEGTLHGDPARRLMRDMYLYWANDQFFEQETDRPFLHDVVQTLLPGEYDAGARLEVSDYLT